MNAQDSIRQYEFGSTVLTINSLNTKYTYAQTRPSFEIMNGLFFRYNNKHSAYRALLSYVENKIDFEEPFDGSVSRMKGTVSNKNFLIGFGAQKNLKQNKDWFYGFVDVCYRNTFTVGSNNDGIGTSEQKYSTNANGFDSYLGLGFKIKIIKKIIVSPELTYNIYFGQALTKFSQPAVNQKSSAYNFNINSLLKIHISAKF